jgi:hypothetical protein
MPEKTNVHRAIAPDKKINDLSVLCGLSYTKWLQNGRFVYSISNNNDLWIRSLTTRDAFMFLLGYCSSKGVVGDLE